MKTKFTFKTGKPTGRYRSFFTTNTDIKIKGKIVGLILGENFTIGFMKIKEDIMEDGNKNCPWKWVYLKKKSSSLEEAKEWLNSVSDNIVAKYNLYYAD